MHHRPIKSLAIAGLFVVLLQLYRLHVYLNSSDPITYAQALTYFRRNPTSIWRNRFKYLKQPRSSLRASICANGNGGDDDLSMLILIISKPTRFESRLAIRASWAADFGDRLLPRRSTVVFVVGLDDGDATESERKKLQSELDHYDDVLIIDMLDTYHNLTLKTAAAFRWTLEHCSGAKLVLKTDDDVVVFGKNLMEYLNGRYDGEKEKLDEAAIHCYEYRWSKVERDRRRLKNFVPFEAIPARYHQPFCSGHAYVLSRSAVQRLIARIDDRATSSSSSENSISPYIHMEDVALTGLLAREANVPRIVRDEFHGERFDAAQSIDSGDSRRWNRICRDWFTVHHLRTPQDILKIWNAFSRCGN